MKSSNLSTRTRYLLAVAGAALIALPTMLALGQAAPAAPAAPAPATTTPAAPPNPVLAEINGKPIIREDFLRILNAVHGMQLFERVINMVLAEQACINNHIDVKPEDDKAEKDRIIANIKDQVEKQGQKPTDAELEGAFNQLMARQGLHPIEVQMTLHTTACLRKLAQLLGQADIKKIVTDKAIQDQFEGEYGPKVKILDIIVPSMEEGSKFRKAVEQDKRFVGEVAAEKGYMTQSYIIPKNVQNIPETITSNAFNPTFAENTLSPVLLVNGTYHILYMQQKIAADSSKKLDAVTKEKIREQMTDQAERSWGNAHLQFLRTQARVQINDPVLLTAYQNWINALKAQAAATQAAATRAAAQTAPAPK